MERRGLLKLAVTGAGLVTVTGCLGSEDGEDETPNGNDGTNQANPQQETNSEECYTNTRTQNEVIVDTSERIEGGYQWTHEYRCESGDTVTFDISASAGQDIQVEIDSPDGQTVYNETGVSLTTTHQFSTAGLGEVRVTNTGDRTKEDREEVWDEREQVGAGNDLSPWLEISEGNSVDYRIRMVDGARPKLRIENSSGYTVREHSVSEVIDDTFTPSEDGRYYFYIENTAILTSGTWDYTFERINQVPITTTTDLTIEREYEEEIESCE